MTKAGSIREYFVFDTKVVHEQKCREDGYDLLNKDEVEVVRIHFHLDEVNGEPLECVKACYDIRKGDLG